jgi:hypothetical protein
VRLAALYRKRHADFIVKKNRSKSEAVTGAPIVMQLLAFRDQADANRRYSPDEYDALYRLKSRVPLRLI